MFGIVGSGAMTRNGKPLASRKRVTCAAATRVSPGGLGLFARTKSHRKPMIVSRSSSIHFASCRLASLMVSLQAQRVARGYTARMGDAKSTDAKRTKEGLRATLADLTALHGAPGFEQPLVQYFRRRVAGLADSVEVDRYGNVTATKNGRQAHPRLMVSAHLDEIGFIVKAIELDGFLRFDRLGGFGDVFLPSRRVSVNGRFGVIGGRPGHLQSADTAPRPPAVVDLYIDVGASSAEE